MINKFINDFIKKYYKPNPEKEEKDKVLSENEEKDKVLSENEEKDKVLCNYCVTSSCLIY